MVTVSAPRRFDCTAASTAVMPPPITTTRRPTGNLREVRRLPEVGDIIDGVDDVGDRAFAVEAELVGSRQAGADEHRRVIFAQLIERDVAAERLAIFDLDAADRQDEIDLGLREGVGRLVGGDAIFVEAAGLRPRLEHDGLMAGDARAHARRRVPPDPAPTIGDRLARRRAARKRLLAGRHLGVDRETLQLADADRLALGGLAHAGFLAQLLGRADARAHAAHDV